MSGGLIHYPSVLVGEGRVVLSQVVIHKLDVARWLYGELDTITVNVLLQAFCILKFCWMVSCQLDTSFRNLN